ncbi:MAG: hypothetical protein OXB94_06300 [Nitrospira sp.]|nr:hypothetical protein [Nitrospira sp.]
MAMMLAKIYEAFIENRLASIENRLIRLEVLTAIVLTGVVSLVVKTFFT